MDSPVFHRFAADFAERKAANREETEPVGILQERIRIGVTGWKHSSHITYAIAGRDKAGEFAVTRRYTDFCALRDCFEQRWPGVFLPCLPSKVLIVRARQGGKEEENVEKRRKVLDAFLRTVAEMRHLYRSEEFQLFIRGGADFKGVSGQMRKVTIAEVAEKYRAEFPESLKAPHSEAGVHLPAYQSLFALLLGNVEVFRRRARLTLDSYHAFQLSCQSLHRALPKYEDTNLRSEQRLLSAVPSEGGSGPNPYSRLYDWLNGEKYDMRAMIDAIRRRTELQTHTEKAGERLKELKSDLERLHSGKAGLFSRKPKEERVARAESLVRAAEGELKDLSDVLAVATVRLLETELPAFKARKSTLYCDVLRKFCADAQQSSAPSLLLLASLCAGFHS